MSDEAPLVHPVPDSTPPEQNHNHLTLLNMARGGMIHRPETALRIGELLLEEHYGADKVAMQHPLEVKDLGDRWRVEGSRNRDKKEEGFGAFYMEIWKYDGRIIDLNIPYIIHPPDWMKEILSKPRRHE